MASKIPEQCRKLEIGTVRDTGEKLIKYNSLAEALGYDRYLSLSHSRLGKCVTACNETRFTRWSKGGNQFRVLNLRKVVEVILPNFMDGFFRELHGQPSRRHWHGTDPREIYHNAEIVLQFLKERLNMSYDPTSPQAQKGTLGEKIFTKLAQQYGWHVENMTAELGTYKVDFMCSDENGEAFLVEVKTYDSKFDVSGRYFSLLDECWDKACNQSRSMNHPLTWCFVDAVTGTAWYADANDLLKPCTINGKNYPERINFDPEGGTQPARAFHINQFNFLGNIDPDDLKQLRAINVKGAESSDAASNASEASDAVDNAPDEEVPTDSTQSEADVAKLTQSLQVPGERPVDLYFANGDYYLIASHLRRATGFTGDKVVDCCKVYRFRQGNKSLRPCFIHLRDVPAFCMQIHDEYKDFKVGSFRKKCAQTARELARWFEDFIPAFYGEKPVQSQDDTANDESDAAILQRTFKDLYDSVNQATKKWNALCDILTHIKKRSEQEQLYDIFAEVFKNSNAKQAAAR